MPSRHKVSYWGNGVGRRLQGSGSARAGTGWVSEEPGTGEIEGAFWTGPCWAVAKPGASGQTGSSLGAPCTLAAALPPQVWNVTPSLL